MDVVLVRHGKNLKGRFLGLAAAVIPFGIGLLAMAMNSERRGWQDRIAQTDVVYVDGLTVSG